MTSDNVKYPDIPHQKNGGSHDTVSVNCADTVELAIDQYEELKARFNSINEWHLLSDKVKAKFRMFDGRTVQPTESIEKRNLVRIDIPGIGNPTGGGFDWTEIIDIQSGGKDCSAPFYSMTLRPCRAPNGTSESVAHFYTAASTNTFVIRRLGTCIYAEVHGRNEIENISGVSGLDYARNKVVAIGGKLGLGKMNWQGFTQALLKPFKE